MNQKIIRLSIAVLLILAVIVMSGCIKPAEFVVSDLIISPREVYVGETVSIRVIVANIGGESDWYTVALMIDGVMEAHETVLVSTTGSKTVDFSVTKEKPGTYEVFVGGLSGSFTVTVAPPLPLQAAGWEGVTVSRLCLKVEQSYPQIEDEFTEPIAEAVQQFLRRIRVQVVDEGEPCDATLTFTVTSQAKGANYIPGGFLYTGAEATGRLELAGEGEPTLSLPLSRSYPPPSSVTYSPRTPQDAPFGAAWRPALLDGLYELWGVQVWVEALNDEDRFVRKAAAEALGGIGDARAVELLIQALLNDESWSVRVAATEALGEIGDAKAVEPLIQALLNDENWSVRVAAVEVLGKMGDARAVEAVIHALLNDESLSVREAAVEVLGEIGDARAVEAVIQALLNDESPSVREAAVEVLGGIGDTKAVEALIQALNDEDWSVREVAAEALGGIGDARAVEAVIQALLNDESWSVRVAATEALGEIGDARAVEPLIQALLNDEDQFVREAAAEALGEIGDARAVEALSQALNDEDWYVQRAADEALKKIRGY